MNKRSSEQGRKEGRGSEWRRAHASTGCVGKEGREGSEGMGVNERSSER